MEVTSSSGVVVWSARDLASELLESFALGLWDQKGSEDTKEHEEGVDLHDVVEPWGGVGGSRTADAEGSNEHLGYDSTDLTRGGGEAVGGRPVASWEALAGNDEGCSVGACEVC